MTLKCGMNRWASAKDVKTADGPTDEAAYERATQLATWLMSDLRFHTREDCPADCDGGRFIKWSFTVRTPYTWPGWKNGKSWWFAAVEVGYDVAVFCLSRKARDALRLHATSGAEEIRLDPYAPPENAVVKKEDLPCESALKLSFTTDFQDTGFGADSDAAQKLAKANVRSRATQMLITWALRFHCASPCIPFLLMGDNEPKVVLYTTMAPWAAIASIEPTATFFCIGEVLGPTVRDRLVTGRFMSAKDAQVFWPKSG